MAIIVNNPTNSIDIGYDIMYHKIFVLYFSSKPNSKPKAVYPLRSIRKLTNVQSTSALFRRK